MSSSSAKMPSRGMPGAGPVLALLLAGATFIGGYYLGSLAGQKAGYRQGSEETKADLKSKIAASGAFPTQTEIHALSGKVTAVRPDGFDLDVSAAQKNPLEDSGPAKRSISVTEKTKISLLKQRDFAEFEAAQKEYLATLQKTSGKTDQKPTEPPQPFMLEPLKLSDIKVGMTVAVSSEANIAKAATIQPTEVTVQPAPPQPAQIPGAPAPGTVPPPGAPTPPPGAPAPGPGPAPTIK